jgi:hypothetical protein
METYTETRIISLNSLYANNKKNSTFLSDVEFYFKNILKDEPNIVRSTIQLVNAQIPVSFYTINYTNDTFKFCLSNLIPINITITRGNYNSSSLITELKSKLLTAGYTFNITISRITGVMTFTLNQAFFIFSNPLGVILGFNTELGSSNIAGVNTLTAPFPLNLLGIKKLKIFSTALSCNSFDSFGSGNNNLINTITVNAPPFGLIIFETITEPLILKSKNISTLDIQITNEDNDLINFNNVSWTLTFQLNIVRTQPALTNPIKSITDVLDAGLKKLDEDIQSLANPQQQDIPTEDNQDNQDTLDNSIDPTNTLDFLQYSGQI